MIRTGRRARRLGVARRRTGAATAIGVLVLLSSPPVGVQAADRHSEASTGVSALVAVLKQSTGRFKEVMQLWAGKERPSAGFINSHTTVCFDAFSGSVQ